MSIEINWTNLVQQITDKDGYNPRNIDWNIPHAIYKDITPIDDLPDVVKPTAMLPANTFNYLDEHVTYDVKYYYRVSEMRPSGEFFTEQVSIEIKHHILKYEAPYLANIEYNGGERDATGNLIPYSELNLYLNDDTNTPEILKPEWFWDGTGRISEWLEFIVNDETVAIKERDTYDKHLKTILIRTDRRNYPAGRIDGMPVMSRAFYLGKDNIVQAPYWWAAWHVEVNEANPATWHAFWQNRFSVWDDTQVWYDQDWTNEAYIFRYKKRPYDNMYGPNVSEPFEHKITDLILRARIGTTLFNGVYNGQVFDPISGWLTATLNGVPRPGNSVGVGLGATLTFRNIKDRIQNGSILSFDFDGVPYSITLSNLIDVNTDNIGLLTTRLEEQINDAVGQLPAGSPEPNIAVSFGPMFDSL